MDVDNDPWMGMEGPAADKGHVAHHSEQSWDKYLHPTSPLHSNNDYTTPVGQSENDTTFSTCTPTWVLYPSNNTNDVTHNTLHHSQQLLSRCLATPIAYVILRLPAIPSVSSWPSKKSHP